MTEAVQSIPTYLTVEQVAKSLGVHPQQVYTLARSKQLPSRRIGKLWRFDPAEVLEWINSGAAGK